MKIQSLSIAVPEKQCINNCKFCCSCMVKEEYRNLIAGNKGEFNNAFNEYIKKLKFVRSNGCNTVMLTGTSEPQQDYEFLKLFGLMNKMLPDPFINIEMQTTGVLLDEAYLMFLRDFVGLTTISLSLSSFGNLLNAEINQTSEKLRVNIERLCHLIKKLGFNLRLSINLTDAFNLYDGEKVFEYCKVLKADQVTFRVLYKSNNNTDKDAWIEEHTIDEKVFNSIKLYTIKVGKKLENLPSGAQKYSVDGITTVIDTDCMSKKENETYRYLILRENCKLYSKWDDKGSLIF